MSHKPPKAGPFFRLQDRSGIFAPLQAFLQAPRKALYLKAAIVSTMLAFTGSTMPEAGSNTGKADPTQFQADPSMAVLLKRIEGEPPDAKKKAITAFRLSLKNEPRVKEKSAYILARVLQKNGTSDELKEAIPLFEEAANFTPLFQRCQFHIADCANTLGNEKLVRTSLENILQKTSDPLLKAQVDYSLAQSYLRAKEDAAANKEFLNVLKLGPDTQFALGARYYLGQAAFQNKNSKDGLRLWRDYLAKSPDGRFAHDIVNALNSNAADELLSADHKLFAEVYYLNGEWTKALCEWKAANADNIWFKEANCLFHLGKTNDGKELLLSSLKEHASDPDVAAAAKQLAHMGTREEAISVWKTVLANCPDFADMALYNLAYRAHDQESLDYYAQLSSKYPKSDFAAESSWWLVWDKIKSGKTASALSELKSCAAKYDKSKPASRFSYWVGKLEEKEKHLAAAKKAYEETIEKFGSHYYGWRARARLNALAGKSDPGWTTDLSKHLNMYASLQTKGGWTWPLPPSLISFKEIAAGSNQTIASLAELQQWDECLELLPQDKLPELRSVCLAKLNLVHDAINTVAHDLHGTPDSQQKWQLAYPLLHGNIVKSEAQAKQVDPLLAHALIREESRYNIYALSSSNAIGLMQLLPSTAMGVAKRLGVNIKSHDDIHKPENNLKLGIDYLSYTLNRFKGNAMLAVASYNGGPNAVASWTHKFELDDPDSFVENIPFGETRDYVRKVFGSYWNYAAIYKPKSQTELSLD